MAIPRLTFFVELETPELEALFARPEVSHFVSAGHCAVSLALLDLSEARARVVRELERLGVGVTAWLLLDAAQGYWLNADNAAAARERWRETAAWAARHDLELHRVGLDIEPPRADTEALARDPVRTLLSLLGRRRSREFVAAAEAEYARLVDEVRSTGRFVESYQFPPLLDERAAGSTLLRRSLGLVDVAVDAEVFMLYASYLGRAGARAYFPESPCIALGVTGGGVHADDPEARRRFLRWEHFEADLRAAAAHSEDVYVFSLEGCVEQGWLERFAGVRWNEPVPALPTLDRTAADLARTALQTALRAETVLDLLPGTRTREATPPQAPRPGAA